MPWPSSEQSLYGPQRRQKPRKTQGPQSDKNSFDKFIDEEYDNLERRNQRTSQATRRRKPRRREPDSDNWDYRRESYDYYDDYYPRRKAPARYDEDDYRPSKARKDPRRDLESYYEYPDSDRYYQSQPRRRHDDYGDHARARPYRQHRDDGRREDERLHRPPVPYTSDEEESFYRDPEYRRQGRKPRQPSPIEELHPVRDPPKKRNRKMQPSASPVPAAKPPAPAAQPQRPAQ